MILTRRRGTIPNSRLGMISPYLQGRDRRMESVFIGIDVSKDSADMFIHPSGERTRLGLSPDDIKKIVKKLVKHKPTLIVMEATGGYQTTLAAELFAGGLPVSVVNPRQVRNFAKALGILAKTDAIDARVLALFAEKIQPPIRPLPTEEERTLKELVMRRRQLLEMRTMELNRQGQICSSHVAKSIKAHITSLNRQIERIEREIDTCIKTSPVWRDKDDLLQSIMSVGPQTSQTMLACMPELGTLNRRKIASLAGLAPINRDSGSFRGKRTISGGRSVVRTALYMPTRNAVRFNPVIKALYQRLIDKGKSDRVAVTACSRKLLTIMNAVLRDRNPWQPLSA